MRRADVVGVGEVGDGAGKLEDAVVGAGADGELGHGGAHDGLGGAFEGAQAAHVAGAHVGVAGEGGALEAGTLALAGSAPGISRKWLAHRAADGAGDLTHERIGYRPSQRAMYQKLLIQAGHLLALSH